LKTTYLGYIYKKIEVALLGVSQLRMNINASAATPPISHVKEYTGTIKAISIESETGTCVQDFVNKLHLNKMPYVR
jgi:hypothetical protein